MSEIDTKWREFYVKGEYKGFRKSREHKYKLLGKTHLTFTNGEKKFFASGLFKEEALAKIFSRIDKYYSNN